MAQNITLLGASYSNVPAVQLPKTGGGTARFTDVSGTTATAEDVMGGKAFYLSDGTKTTGTAIRPEGSQNITANGTYNVTALASVVVNVHPTSQTVTKDVTLAKYATNTAVTFTFNGTVIGITKVKKNSGAIWHAISGKDVASRTPITISGKNVTIYFDANVDGKYTSNWSVTAVY